MAAPAYATDLTQIHEANVTTSWTNIGTGAPAAEADYYIQQGNTSWGNNCVSKGAWAGAMRGLIYTGSSISVPTDGAVISWITHLTPNSLAAISNGGIRIIIGNTTAAYNHWYVGGSDTLNFGGEWVPYVVNPGVAVSNTTGSPNSSLITFGGLANLPTTGPTKGNPFAIDVTRYGRGELQCTAGEGGNYATVAGAAAYDGDITRKWGLMLLRDGAYFMQGLFVMGTAATAVNFVDANRTVFIRNTVKSTANFNGFEVRNASSNVNWTAISVQALGTTSPGRWITTDNATINLTSCTFTDMGTFSFKPNTTITTTTFRRCGQITLANSHFTTNIIDSYTGAANTSAVVWDHLNPSGYLDGCQFVMASGGNNHALELGNNVPDVLTLTGMSFTGYGTSDGNANSAIHLKRSTGSVIIYSAALPSVLSEGASYSVQGSSVNIRVNTKDTNDTNINDAVVLLKAVVAGGPFPANATVTIVNTGTSANVAHTSHGMATGDKVLIDGASHWQNNGVFTITKTNDNYYSYTMPEAPGSDPTGTIKATFVALFGNTSSGTLTTSRTYSANQAVTGWVRKAPIGGPWYKTTQLTGTIDNAAGYTTTAVMVADS